MKLKAILPFDWAHGGVKVEHFPVGAEIETEDEALITVSTSEGWAVEVAPASLAAEPASVTPAAKDPDAAQAPAAPKRSRAKQ